MNIKFRIKTITIFLIIFLILMGLPFLFDLTSVYSTAEATTTRYVGGTGPGNYSKIQDAIDNANPGDIIRVYSGTYNENLNVNKKITIIGNGTGKSIISGSGSGDVVAVIADFVNITNFSIRNSGSDWTDAGIEIYFSDYCKIENCAFPNNERSIYLDYSSFNIIRNNTCNSNQWDGIKLSDSSNNLIEKNTCSINWNGIELTSSSSNTFIGNTFSNNQNAISMDLSTNNIFYSNSMYYSGIRIFGVNLNEWNTHTISQNNTVNNNPIYYWKNKNGGTIPSGAGQIILANCNNVVVENQNINEGSTGIQLGFSDNNFILNNTCKSQTWAGIEIRDSSNNLINNNLCSDISWGIMLSVSSDNIITNNTFRNNGIEGMSIFLSTGNIIKYNNFTSNDVGIDISSDDNHIYYNNFRSNDQHATNDGSNYWDNNQEGGNYWDDYNGDDNGADGRVKGDGIGDTNLPHLGLDNYPFIKQSGWLYPGIPTIIDLGDVDIDGEYSIMWDKMRGTIGYILEEDESNSFNSPEELYIGSNLFYQIQGKVNGTYYYRLKAHNDRFESAWSEPVDIDVDWLPAIPQNLNATSYPEGNAINLSWDLNTVDIKEYDIYYKTTGTWTLLTTITHPVHTYNHTNLINYDQYYYKIQARDFRDQLSDFSNIIDAIPIDSIPPSPPTGLNLNVLSYDSILLNWDASNENDLLGYNIYRSNMSNLSEWGDPINGLILIQETHYTDLYCEEGTIYYYAITAVDDELLESDYSEVKNVTTFLDEHGPEINHSISDFKIYEDTIDDTSINLYYWFKDVNKDKLLFRCTGENHIEVTINQKTGSVTLKPENDWNGEERLTFYAADDEKETSDKIKITVIGVNDPPGPVEIISPSDNIKINDGEFLDFEATCDDPDIKYGDELVYNWTSNIAGKIGSSITLDHIKLPVGIHQITIEVSDQLNETSISSIRVTVQETPESDTDSDGMPNIWERDHGLDPNDPTDANEDLDNDGKTNLEEYKKDTDPTINDSEDKEMEFSIDLIGAIIAIIVFFVIIVIFIFVIKPRVDKKIVQSESGIGQSDERLQPENHPDLQDLHQTPQIQPRLQSKPHARVSKSKSDSAKPPAPTLVSKVHVEPSTQIPIPQVITSPTVNQDTIFEMEMEE